MTPRWGHKTLGLLGPVLAFWTLIAPTALGFDASTPALAGHIAFAMAFLPLTVIAMALRPALAVCGLGGAWPAISPWVTGYAPAETAAWINDLVVGALLMTWSATATTAHYDSRHNLRTPPAAVADATVHPEQRSTT